MSDVWFRVVPVLSSLLAAIHHAYGRLLAISGHKKHRQYGVSINLKNKANGETYPQYRPRA